MTVTITPVDHGTIPGDATGDTAFVSFQTLNANEQNIKTAIESLQGRFWTIRNTTLDPLVMGARYIANAHAGIVFTLPAAFAVSATAESDIWIANADDAASITLTPASGDALFVAGVTLGVDATYALTFGKIAILSPRTTDSEWDVVLTSSSGGSGDFLKDGSVAMTGELVTTPGTFGSSVANGASAVGFRLGTVNAFSTSGAKLLTLDNAGTDVLGVSYQGGISHMNSGASTAAHAQSLNLNWSSTTTKTSSGLYSAVIGSDNKANGTRAIALGYNNDARANESVCIGSGNTANDTAAVAIGIDCWANNTGSLAAGGNCSTYANFSSAHGQYGYTTNPCTLSIGAGAVEYQASFAALKAATTDATQTTMTASIYSTKPVIPADTTWAFSALIVARSDEADGNEQAAWEIKGLLGRDEANSTALVGTPVVVQLAASTNAIADGWAVVAEADDTNEALALKVTGFAATNIRWVAKVDISQVTFA